MSEELDPIPIKKSPIEANNKFRLVDKMIFPTEHIPIDNRIEILRPKLSLKYENPIKPINIPIGKLS